MKWVCIDSTGYEDQLIVGKVYENIDTGFVDYDCILIRNELGFVCEYHQPNRFISRGDWRDRQLKKIGI